MDVSKFTITPKTAEPLDKPTVARLRIKNLQNLPNESWQRARSREELARACGIYDRDKAASFICNQIKAGRIIEELRPGDDPSYFPGPNLNRPYAAKPKKPSLAKPVDKTEEVRQVSKPDKAEPSTINMQVEKDGATFVLDNLSVSDAIRLLEEV